MKIRNKKNIIIFFIILFFVLIGPTLGRYAYKEIRNFYFNSKNFYFNADKLGESIKYYQIENWSGIESYDVTYNLNSYKNNNVFSESDISYDVKYNCSDNLNCQINKTSGIIYASKHTDSFVITLNPKQTLKDGDNAWVEVEVNSTSPYKKTLRGKFTIKVGKMGLSYQIIDSKNQPYFDLAITNTLDYYLVRQAFNNYSEGDKLDINTYLSLSEEEKKYCASSIVSVNFDPKVVLLDMTTSAYLNSISNDSVQLENYDYINSLEFKVDALSSYNVRFYKVNSNSDYTYPIINNKSIVNVSFD